MFQFPTFASFDYGFIKGYRKLRWVAPFGYPRIKDRSHLPAAFRKVLRPSSPLSAKAFTKCSCLLVLSLRIYKLHTHLLTINRPSPFVRRTGLWIFAHKY